MTWGAWKYRAHVLVPNEMVGVFLDDFSLLLGGDSDQTLMLNMHQYSSNGAKPFTQAGVSVVIHEDYYQDTIDLFDTNLSGITYYICSAETGNLLNTNNDEATIGQPLTWVDVINIAGLVRTSSPDLIDNRSTIFDFEPFIAPNSDGGDTDGKSVWVSNDSDHLPGSFRMASLLPYPRHIKFTQPMTVSIATDVGFANVTLDGRDSAICIRGAQTTFSSESIVVNCRFRPGVVAEPTRQDALSLTGSRIYIEKSSITWGADGLIEIGADDVFIRDCIIANDLYGYDNSARYYQCRAVLGMDGADNVTFYRCIFYGNTQRNPEPGGGRWDVLNCWFGNILLGINFDARYKPLKMNIAGNVFAPNTTEKIDGIGYAWNFIHSFRTQPEHAAYWETSGAYIANNINMSFPERGSLLMQDAITLADTPYSNQHIDLGDLMVVNSLESGQLLEDSLLTTCGARNNGSLDPVDQAIFTAIANKSYRSEFVSPLSITYPDLALL